MRRSQVIMTITTIMLFLSVMSVYQVQSASVSDSHVEAVFTCTFVTAAQLKIHVQMLVNRIDNIYGTSYDHETIQSISTSDLEVMGIIKQRLRDAAKAQIETAFLGSEISAIGRPSYVNPNFIDVFHVNLTTTFFRYYGSLNLTTLLSGVLDMNATVTYRFNLQSGHGWNTTYTYILPGTIRLAYANTEETSYDSNSASWMVRNWAGGGFGKEAVLSMQSKNPTTSGVEKEEIELEFAFDARKVNPISFTNTIILRSLNIQDYSLLPDFITGLTYLPADGVRLFIENNLLSWEQVFEMTIQPIEQETTPILENSSFKQPLRYTFNWDAESTVNCSTPYNITRMDDEPAVKALFKASAVDLDICRMPARGFFGLINAGATALVTQNDMSFGYGLEELMYPFISRIWFPHNITLDGQNVYTWNRTKYLGGAFSSNLQPAPPYDKEHIEMRMDIELSKMDLSIQNILTGKTELTASLRMREDVNIYILRRPSELSLHPKINITYMSSDAIRVCIEEEIFDDNQTNEFLAQKTDAFQQRSSEIVGIAPVTGIIDRKMFSNSLRWDGDISSMDAVVPVIISNSANAMYTIAFNMSLWPAELNIVPLEFTLQGIENQTITYRFVFPRGISVNASDSAGKTIITGKTTDGSEYVELLFDPQSSHQITVLTCVLSASPVYVLGLFLPCLLVFVLLVLLAVIVYLIRKRKSGLRRRRERHFEPEDEEEDEPTEYVEQEYYVPPPPRLRKKRK